ncbi:MAG: hypothetical protein GC158_00280 [Cyanobacteria bacterium RI_101]|nr:hypothetical protein [Cyanobacteria bacterium RI_101]
MIRTLPSLQAKPNAFFGFGKKPSFPWSVIFIFALSGFSLIGNAYYRIDSLQHQAHNFYHSYLLKIGLTDNFFIFYFFGLEALVALGFAITGLLIVWQRSRSRVAFFIASVLVTYGVTIPPSMHSITVNLPELPLPLRLMRGVGLGLFMILFYVFPNGRFTPPWSLGLAVAIGVWSLTWPFYEPLNPYHWPEPWPFVILGVIFGTGIIAQLYRYFQISRPEERQQAKWAVFGLTLSVIGDFLTHLPWALWRLEEGPDWFPLLVHHPFFIATQLLIPLSIGVSILKFGLWEIDFIIDRTLVYTLISTFLAVVWAVLVKVLEVTFIHFIGRGALPLATGAAVLVAFLAFKPTYNRLEAWSHRFNPQRIDFTREFIEFLPNISNVIALEDLTQVLAQRTVALSKTEYGGVFLKNNRDWVLKSVEKISLQASQNYSIAPEYLAQLEKGVALQPAEGNLFSLLIPLALPREKQVELVGILGLGPRENGRGYSSDDRHALQILGRQAGVALYIAQLNEQRRDDQREQIAALQAQLRQLRSELKSNS